MIILLKIFYALCILFVCYAMSKMYKDFDALPNGFIGKSSLAWGVIFAFAWIVYLFFKIIL